VNGARPDDDDQPVVHTVQDPVQGLARAEDEVGDRFRAGELADEVRGRNQLFQFANADIVGVVWGHVGFLLIDSYGVRAVRTVDGRGAKKNRRACRRFSFGNSCLLNALTPLSIRRRTEMPKEVKVKLRCDHG
jgi:hypothetical protein